MPRPAVFLDRDDTLIENGDLPPESWAGGRHGDLCDPRFVTPISGAVEACGRLARAGYCLVVVSNQGLVARGHGTIEEVEATNATLRRCFLDSEGRGLFAVIYYAPHHPSGTVPPYNRDHPWRKPGPGMLLAAADAFDLDLARSWTVGDKARDLEAGRRAGLRADRCLLVTRQFTLAQAAERILGRS